MVSIKSMKNFFKKSFQRNKMKPNVIEWSWSLNSDEEIEESNYFVITLYGMAYMSSTHEEDVIIYDVENDDSIEKN